MCLTTDVLFSHRGSTQHMPGAVRAFRSQLPRSNPFYPDTPIGEGDAPQELTSEQRAAVQAREDRWRVDTADGVCTYAEAELVVEPEDDPEDEEYLTEEMASKGEDLTEKDLDDLEEVSGDDDQKQLAVRGREGRREGGYILCG